MYYISCKCGEKTKGFKYLSPDKMPEGWECDNCKKNLKASKKQEDKSQSQNTSKKQKLSYHTSGYVHSSPSPKKKKSRSTKKEKSYGKQSGSGSS